MGREIGHNEIRGQFEAYSNDEEHRAPAEEG
jgi:hypothetical protein